MGLSVIVITRNEEQNIESCLESVKWADEIVVVDSHSTDRTVEIAHRYTDKVLLHDFDGYSEQKAFALSQATCDWVLNLDADESLSPKLQKEIRTVVDGGSGKAGYLMPRLTWYLGRPIRHCGWYPDYQLRLFRREKSCYPQRLIHERVRVDGTVGKLKGDIIHKGYLSLQQHVEKQRSYTLAMADQMFSDGKRCSLFKLITSPVCGFLNKYLLKRGMLDGAEGFILCCMYAHYVFMKYALLWEMQRKRSGCGERPR